MSSIKQRSTKTRSLIQLYSILLQLPVLVSPTRGTVPHRQIHRKTLLEAQKRTLAALFRLSPTILQSEGI